MIDYSNGLMWCFVKTAAIFLCKAVSLYSRLRPRMSCASRIFWSSKNLSGNAILLFMRTQYALAVRFLFLFGQSGIFFTKDFSTPGKRYRLDGTVRLRRETQPTALPSDDNPGQSIAAFEAMAIDRPHRHVAPWLAQNDA